MSYDELNLDVRKALKKDLKVALRVGSMALHAGKFLHMMAIFLCFDFVRGFSLMEDFLLM